MSKVVSPIYNDGLHEQKVIFYWALKQIQTQTKDNQRTKRTTRGQKTKVFP